MQLRVSSPTIGFFLEKAGHEMGTEFLSILRRQRGALRVGGSESSAAASGQRVEKGRLIYTEEAESSGEPRQRGLAIRT